MPGHLLIDEIVTGQVRWQVTGRKPILNFLRGCILMSAKAGEILLESTNRVGVEPRLQNRDRDKPSDKRRGGVFCEGTCGSKAWEPKS